MASRVNFIQYNNLSDFESLQDKDDFTLYFIVETQQIYKGSRLFSSNVYVGTNQHWVDHKDDIYPKGAILYDTTHAILRVATGYQTVDQLSTIDTGETLGISADADGNLWFNGTASAVKGTLSFGTVDNPQLYSYNGSEDVQVTIYTGE